MKRENKKASSIKWKIFGSLIFFVGVIIAILWLFQVFFLENFYMYIKSNAVKRAADTVTTVIEQDDYETTIQNLAKENDVCVNVYTTKLSSLGTLDHLFSSSEFRCKNEITKLNTQTILALQNQVTETGEGASKLLEEDDTTTVPIPPINEKFDSFQGEQKAQITKFQNYQRRTYRNITHVSVVKSKDADTLKTIIIEAQLTPVNATVDTLKAQFLIIAIILILVATGLALYLSRKIANPLMDISKSAKGLASGNLGIDFHGEGYLEVAELSNILNYASKELGKVEKLRKELIANMSHDLRTPLTMITGYSEMMRDIPGENTPENVQIVIDETTRLTTLVNDMLDLSKLQAGTLEIKASTFNITQEIKAIISRYDKLLSNQNVKVTFTYDREVMVSGDVVKLGQVIYNLANNAINYCGEDRLVQIKQVVQEDTVSFHFIDHGEGIEKEQLPYIWERYYKVDKTHVRSKVGTGLGLSIVKVILDLHHAEYGVKSVLHQGSDFWFTLLLEE